MTVQNKSVANMDLLLRAKRLIWIKNNMQCCYSYYSGAMGNNFRIQFRNGESTRPLELTDQEIDRFMIAAYKDAVMVSKLNTFSLFPIHHTFLTIFFSFFFQ